MSERLATEDAEPTLDLVQPTGMVGREVTAHWDDGLARGHAWFGGAEIVEDDVDFLAGIVCNDLVHEREELLSAAALGVHPADRSREDVQGRKERRRAVALVFVAHTADGFAVGQAEVLLGRSSARICGFSSTERTMAFSGGLR